MKFENLTGKQFRGTRSNGGKRLEDGTRGVGKLCKNRIGGYERSRADEDPWHDINEVPRRQKLLSESLAIAESGDCAVRIERFCQITGRVLPEGEVTLICQPNDLADPFDPVLVVRYNSEGRLVSSHLMAPRRALRLPGVRDFREDTERND